MIEANRVVSESLCKAVEAWVKAYDAFFAAHLRTNEWERSSAALGRAEAALKAAWGLYAEVVLRGGQHEAPPTQG